jgi:hypothetical protein
MKLTTLATLRRNINKGYARNIGSVQGSKDDTAFIVYDDCYNCTTRHTVEMSSEKAAAFVAKWKARAA